MSFSLAFAFVHDNNLATFVHWCLFYQTWDLNNFALAKLSRVFTFEPRIPRVLRPWFIFTYVILSVLSRHHDIHYICITSGRWFDSALFCRPWGPCQPRLLNLTRDTPRWSDAQRLPYLFSTECHMRNWRFPRTAEVLKKNIETLRCPVRQRLLVTGELKIMSQLTPERYFFSHHPPILKWTTLSFW